MDLIEKAYSCTKLWISMIVAIIYSVLLVSYQHHIQGLEKPAGMQEALVFLFNYPQDYFGALILGLVIHAREFDTLKSKKVPQSLEIGLFFCQIFIFII